MAYPAKHPGDKYTHQRDALVALGYKDHPRTIEVVKQLLLKHDLRFALLKPWARGYMGYVLTKDLQRVLNSRASNRVIEPVEDGPTQDEVDSAEEVRIVDAQTHADLLNQIEVLTRKVDALCRVWGVEA